jgi:thiol:disulfide interchange protein DsbD
VGFNLLLFFVGGLLLALTPCLFPMFPILTGILAGEGKSITRLRAFTLSLSYVLGMAVTYAMAGVMAGLSGTLISTALQLPWVQVATALLYVAFALAMFDLYHLQLPLSLQNRLHGLHVHLPSGHHVGAVLMGMLSALIVGPCVAAPLAGALLYIGQTHDLLFGGTALFTLALGMGTPLILVGVSEGMLLPKAGGWMVWVKRVIGVLLLLVAAWQVYPLVHGWLEKPSASATLTTPYHPVKTMGQLDAELSQARKAHQPVMVDFYADWCISCIEMEQKVFPKPEVKKTLEKGVWLRVDVTANDSEAHALLSRYQLLGPPGFIFYDAQGMEVPHGRLVGFVEPATLLEVLNQTFR